MTNNKTFRELAVWQKGMELARHVYQMTQGFPEVERLGLAFQMRRAAVSVRAASSNTVAKATSVSARTWSRTWAG